MCSKLITMQSGSGDVLSPFHCNHLSVCPCCFRLTGKSPFHRATEEAVISAITAGQVDLSGKDFTNLSTEAQDFVSACLAKNPRRRPAALQCQRHRWLSGGRKPSVGQGSPLGRRGSFGSPTTRRRMSSGSEKGGEKRKSKASPSSPKKVPPDGVHR